MLTSKTKLKIYNKQRQVSYLTYERSEIIKKVKLYYEDHPEVYYIRQQSNRYPEVTIQASYLNQGDKEQMFKRLVHNITKIQISPNQTNEAVIFEAFFDEDNQLIKGPIIYVKLDKFLASGIKAFNVNFTLKQNGFRCTDDMEKYLPDLVSNGDFLINQHARVLSYAAFELHQDILLFREKLTTGVYLLSSYNYLVNCLVSISWKSLQLHLEKLSLEGIQLASNYRVEDIELLCHIVFILKIQDLLYETYIYLLAAEDLLSQTFFIVRFSRVFHESIFNNHYAFLQGFFPKTIIGKYRDYNIIRSYFHGYEYNSKNIVRRIMWVNNNECGAFFKEFMEDQYIVEIQKSLHLYATIPDSIYQMFRSHINSVIQLIHSTTQEEYKLPLHLEPHNNRCLLSLTKLPTIEQMEESKISNGTMQEEPPIYSGNEQYY